jgi:uncharacterized DUF497 family protein
VGQTDHGLMVVVHTYPEEPNDRVIRIISARLASNAEWKYYVEGGTDES